MGGKRVRMEGWQRRYKQRKEDAYQKYLAKLSKVERPDYISPGIFKQVVYKTAMRMAEKYMTSLRMGERNV